jgi:hypothetical protein
MSNKWAKALLIVVLTWVVLMSCQSILQSEQVNVLPHLLGIGSWVEERNESLAHPSAELAELEVESQNGSVTLIGSDDVDEITIEARYRAQASSQASANKKLEQMSTDISAEGNRLVIRAVFSSTKMHESISYTVTLPSALLVQAKTSNGSLEATDLSGAVTLNTSNGRITVTSEQGPKELIARTSNGSITVKAAPESGCYNLRTSNGSVRIELPEELGINLSAKTSNGSINLGSGNWSFEGGRISKNQVDAKRGNGELELIITTSNGSITLQD